MRMRRFPMLITSVGGILGKTYENVHWVLSFGIIRISKWWIFCACPDLKRLQLLLEWKLGKTYDRFIALFCTCSGLQI